MVGDSLSFAYPLIQYLHSEQTSQLPSSLTHPMTRWQCYACQDQDDHQVSLIAKLRVDETIPMINIERAYKLVRPPPTTGTRVIHHLLEPILRSLSSLLIYVYHKLM